MIRSQTTSATLRIVEIVHVQLIRRRVRAALHVPSRDEDGLDDVTNEWLRLARLCHLHFDFFALDEVALLQDFLD